MKGLITCLIGIGFGYYLRKNPELFKDDESNPLTFFKTRERNEFIVKAIIIIGTVVMWGGIITFFWYLIIRMILRIY